MNKDNCNRSYYRRPILLSILAVLMVLSGAISAIVGALLIFGGTLSIPIDPPAGMEVVTSGALDVLFGIIYLLIGLALFSGKKWGWWFATIMTILSLISGIFVLNYLGIILSLIVLLYLSTKNTRGWFEV